MLPSRMYMPLWSNYRNFTTRRLDEPSIPNCLGFRFHPFLYLTPLHTTMKTYTTTKRSSWGSRSAWKKGTGEPQDNHLVRNVAPLPSQVGKQPLHLHKFPRERESLREHSVLIVQVVPSTHYKACPKSRLVSYLAIWPLRKILLPIDLHGYVFSILISDTW